MKELIGRFAKTATFLLVAKNNALISLYQPGPREAFLFVQKFLIEGLLDEQTRRALAKKFPQGPPADRVVFHRKQLLFLMKLVLLYSQDSGLLDPSADVLARHELGKVCLMVNDLLMTPDQEAALTQADGSRHEWERVHDELYSQFIPGAELSSVPDVHSALARSDEYLAIFERESAKLSFAGGRNLLKRFQSLTSLDLRRYLRFMLGAHTLYGNLAEDPEKFINAPTNFNLARGTIFAKMRVTKNEVDTFFDLCASDLLQLAGEIRAPSVDGDIRFINDLIPFRKRPLTYTTPEREIATLLDFQFLGEKISHGLYHTVLDGFVCKEPDRSNFLSYWGDVFEIYVNDRLREAFPAKTRKFFYSPMFDFNKKGFQAFDGALALASDLVVFEEKGKYLSVPAKYGGNKDELRKDLDERFGKGVRQLARSLEMVFHRDPSKRKTFSEYDSQHQPVNAFDLQRIKKVRRVYPILVVQDFSLELGFANWNLRDLFREEIAKAEVALGLIRPITVMTVQDLESVMPCLKHVTLQNILDYHAKHLEPIFTFKYIFSHYMLRRKVERCPNAWVDRRVRDIIEAMRAMFHEID